MLGPRCNGLWIVNGKQGRQNERFWAEGIEDSCSLVQQTGPAPAGEQANDGEQQPRRRRMHKRTRFRRLSPDEAGSRGRARCAASWVGGPRHLLSGHCQCQGREQGRILARFAGVVSVRTRGAPMAIDVPLAAAAARHPAGDPAPRPAPHGARICWVGWCGRGGACCVLHGLRCGALLVRVARSGSRAAAQLIMTWHGARAVRGAATVA